MKEYTEEDLFEKIQYRFNGSGYVVIPHVRNTTGAAFKYGIIDALVLSLWPSNGLERIACEIKTDRSDFLNESQNSEKNKFFRKHCHRFWYIAPTDVIKEKELPKNVGWMRPHGDTLAIVKSAPLNEDVESTDGFWMSICRALKEQMEYELNENIEDEIRKHAEFKEALVYKEAVTKIFKKYDVRRPTMFGNSLHRLEEQFVDLIEGEKFIQDQKKTMQLLDDFRGRMHTLFEIFMQIASYSLAESDEAGERIVKGYGGLDNRDLDVLKEKVKENRDMYFSKDKMKNIIKVRGIIEELLDESEGE